MTLAGLIALARELKGWSLRDLERESGVSNALISQIEHRKVKDPGFSTVVALCDALGFSLDRAAEPIRSHRKVLREANERQQLGAPAPPSTEAAG